MYRINKVLRTLSFAVLLMTATMAGNSMTNQAFAEEKAEEGVPALDPNRTVFVKLSPIIVPIMTEEGTTQIVTLVVALEVGSATNEGLVEENRLRLTDAFLTDMYGVFDKNILIKNGFIDVERVKYRLSKISKKILGEEVVTGVLLQAVQQRKV